MSSTPFLDLPLKRMPGLPLAVAQYARVGLLEYLAPLFFASVHDNVDHACLFKDCDDPLSTIIHLSVLAPMESLLERAWTTLYGLEWAYLPEGPVVDLIEGMAKTASEAAQRWLMSGIEPILSLNGMPALILPAATVKYFQFFGQDDLAMRAAARTVRLMRQNTGT